MIECIGQKSGRERSAVGDIAFVGANRMHRQPAAVRLLDECGVRSVLGAGIADGIEKHMLDRARLEGGDD